jgi:hypothetical protein
VTQGHNPRGWQGIQGAQHRDGVHSLIAAVVPIGGGHQSASNGKDYPQYEQLCNMMKNNYAN